METLTLNAKLRNSKTKGDLNNIRKASRVPGVVYGLKQDNVSIDVDSNELKHCMGSKNANKVVELKIEGGSDEKVIIKEVVRHPVRQFDISHVDFIRVNDTQPVVVKVPVKTEGVPVGVKNEGGSFQIMKKFVKIKAVINNIPESFTMDVSEMHSGEVFYTRDLEFKGGTVLTPAKTALHGVSGRRGGKLAVEETPAAAEEAPAEGAEATAEEAK